MNKIYCAMKEQQDDEACILFLMTESSQRGRVAGPVHCASPSVEIGKPNIQLGSHPTLHYIPSGDKQISPNTQRLLKDFHDQTTLVKSRASRDDMFKSDIRLLVLHTMRTN